jgi:acyl-CoA synthetase (NDP forming)
MRDLKNFFEPKSVAVIGVSREPNKVGHVLFKNLVEGGFKGRVYPVNPNLDEVLGFSVYKSLRELPCSYCCTCKICS